MNRFAKIALGAFAAAAIGGSAQAATIVSACNANQISPDAVACSGWFEGNLLNTSGTHIQDQKDALASLGFVWNGVWAPVEATKVLPVDNTYDFAALLNGDTWIGVHKGNGGQGGFSGTAFFKLNANNLDTFKLDLNGGSTAVLYKTGSAVPEPATWAMLIAGFGLAGSAIRRRRVQTALA